MEKMLKSIKKIAVISIAVLCTIQGVWANTAIEIRDQINIPQYHPLNATVSGNIVTVTGTFTGAPSGSNFLTLNIGAGVTVRWDANLSGNPSGNFALINISGGSGTFEVRNGRTIENTGTGRVIINNSAGTVSVLGGTVRSAGSETIFNAFTGIVNVSSGRVENTANGNAIYNENSTLNSPTGTIIVSGGSVLATSGSAIHTRSIFGRGEAGRVNISSGTISSIFGEAILNFRDTVTISGGTVSSTSFIAISNSGMVTISGNASITSASANSLGTISLGTMSGSTLNVNGGTVENTSNGRAIYGEISNATINVRNGIVRSVNGNAIYTWAGSVLNNATINISGGRVESTNSNTIVGDGNLNVSGGTITTSGNGSSAVSIATSLNRWVRITGGTISTTQSSGFAFNIANNVNNVMLTIGGNPTITGRIFIHREKLEVIPDGTEAFAPSAQRIYTLDFPDNQYVSGNIAVMNGWNFPANFRLHNSNFALIRSGLNLVMAPARTVIFNLNGAAGTPPSPVSVASGGTLSSLPTASWTGYTFSGWFTQATGGTQITTSTPINTDMTVFARWTPIVYNITYIHNHNNDTTRRTYTILQTPITLITPSRAGYFFNGWFNNSNLTGTAITTIPANSTGDRTFWARWLPTFTITFDANEGTVYPTFGTTGHGGLLTYLPEPTRDGYTFNGWFTKIDGGTQVTTNTAFNADTTIYAQWTIKASNTAFISQNQIEIYPNPVVNQLQITTDNLQIGEMIELFDMTGKRVYSARINCHSSIVNRHFTIDMSAFQQGNYILRIGNRVAKIVKQ